MPGAQPSEAAADVKETPTETPPASEVKAGKPDESTGFTPEERKELERLRAVHKDERKQEQRAKENFDDAERWRQLAKTIGGGESKDFDPKSAIEALNAKFEAAEQGRIISEVARTEGVDPDIIHGDTEDAMRESAQRYKAKVEAAVELALKGRAPAAAPASEVTSNGKVDGPRQITSRDELKNMSPKERLDAYKDGRLDELTGKR
jgi:hypothetical protein